MVEHGTDNPRALAWHMAEGLIREFLVQSPWAEEVVDIRRGAAGRLEVRPEDGHRRYWFRRCPLTVRRPDGEARERVYSFVFDWCEGRWQLQDVPAVCV